jgi:hypothetical protein
VDFPTSLVFSPLLSLLILLVLAIVSNPKSNNSLQGMLRTCEESVRCKALVVGCCIIVVIIFVCVMVAGVCNHAVSKVKEKKGNISHGGCEKVKDVFTTKMVHIFLLQRIIGIPFSMNIMVKPS